MRYGERMGTGKISDHVIWRTDDLFAFPAMVDEAFLYIEQI